MVIDDRKVPEFVVKFESTDEALKARIKGLPEEQVAGTHYNEEGMTRRLLAYNKNNFSESGSPVLATFFNENNIEILNLKLENMTDEEVFKAMKIFIERVLRLFGVYTKSFHRKKNSRTIKILRKLKSKRERGRSKRSKILKRKNRKLSGRSKRIGKMKKDCCKRKRHVFSLKELKSKKRSFWMSALNLLDNTWLIW